MTADDHFLNVEPSANYRPGQPKLRARKSVDHTIRHGVRSMLRSVTARSDFDVPDLTTLAAVSDELDAALDVAVFNLRLQGHSWQVIADALGVTRQAAHKRFAGVGECGAVASESKYGTTFTDPTCRQPLGHTGCHVGMTLSGATGFS